VDKEEKSRNIINPDISILLIHLHFADHDPDFEKFNLDSFSEYDILLVSEELSV
jgi:hypothetical protein